MFLSTHHHFTFPEPCSNHLTCTNFYLFYLWLGFSFFTWQYKHWLNLALYVALEFLLYIENLGVNRFYALTFFAIGATLSWVTKQHYYHVNTRKDKQEELVLRTSSKAWNAILHLSLYLISFWQVDACVTSNKFPFGVIQTMMIFLVFVLMIFTLQLYSFKKKVMHPSASLMAHQACCLFVLVLLSGLTMAIFTSSKGFGYFVSILLFMCFLVLARLLLFQKMTAFAVTLVSSIAK